MRGVANENDALFSQFGELFSEFFATSKSEGRGADRRIALPLSLEEAAMGASKVVRALHGVRCARCKGDGGEPGSIPHPCYVCEGKGQITKPEEPPHTCERCEGKKTIDLVPCVVCRGKKLVPRDRELTVKVPAGIEDGQILRLAKQGDEAPRRGPPGDLLLEVVVAPHPRLRREGADLFVEVPIDAKTAREGGSVEVPVLGGTRRVKVPASCLSGMQVRLRGHGAVRLGCEPIPVPAATADPYRSMDASAHRGDQIVTFLVKEGDEDPEEAPKARRAGAMPWAIGLAAALAVAVLGAIAAGR